MLKRRITVLAFVAIGVAALAGCGSKASPTPASSGGGSTPTTITPVTSSGGGGNGY
jgi:ABC-type glycerol-3-phosphate transport system substrate-binding protein